MTTPPSADDQPPAPSGPGSRPAPPKPDPRLFSKPRASRVPPPHRTSAGDSTSAWQAEPPPDGVIGPLRSTITVAALQTPSELNTANALLILRRCAVVKDGAIDDEPVQAWAVRTGLGHAQASTARPDLQDAVHERRTAAVKSLKRAAVQARIVELRCDGPVLTGVGEVGLRDIGIAMHGTYGWPVLPASTLKGVAHAYARDEDGMSAEDRVDLFGGPRPDADTEHVGKVTFLDGLPLDVVLAEHVLTPHFRDYYDDAEIGEPSGHINVRNGVPPAEYFNPVPVSFLAVDQGTFRVLLLGPPAQVEKAESLLKAAVEWLGLGAKTAAGYGYLKSGDGQVM